MSETLNTKGFFINAKNFHSLNLDILKQECLISYKYTIENGNYLTIHVSRIDNTMGIYIFQLVGIIGYYISVPPQVIKHNENLININRDFKIIKKTLDTKIINDL